MVIKRVRLHQVDDIEPVKFSGAHVCYSEVVPLGIATCVVVWLQDKVVFILVNLDGSPQVTRLEAGLKQQSVIICSCWDVEGWNVP